MLPDFPALKSELYKIVLAKLRHLVDTGDPVLSQIKRFTQHEGLTMRYEQHGGDVVQEGFEQIGINFEIAKAEVPDLVGQKLDTKLREIADPLVSKAATMFFKKMAESCEKAGTSLDAKGKPLSAEMFLDMISTTQVEFDATGKPTNSFVIHPDMLPVVKQIAEQLENDPELKRRHAEILERQREAWAARENNRKLVD